MGTLFIYVESFFKIKHLSLAEQVFGKRVSLSVHLVWNKSSHENKKSFKSILSSGVLHSFPIKSICYDKMNLRLLYF